MASRANMGFFGNGRAFEYLINNLLAHPLKEANQIGQLALQELKKVVPSFMHRPEEKHGIDLQNYLKDQRQARTELYNNYFAEIPDQQMEPSVNIVRYDADAEINIIAASMFTESNLPLSLLREIARSMTYDEQQRFFQKAAAGRKNRFQKLSRAFEAAKYEFEIIADIGVFKDFKRHRICSQERQPYTTSLGYIIPDEIVEIGAEDRYIQLMDRADEIYQLLNYQFPLESEYVIPMAYLMRDRIELNLRELAYLIEIRSISAGHPSYRFIAQEMHRQLEKIHPHFADLILCEFDEVEMERLKSEERIDEKINSLKNQ